MVSYSPPVADSVLPFNVKCDMSINAEEATQGAGVVCEACERAADLGLDGPSQLHCAVWVTLMLFVNQHILVLWPLRLAHMDGFITIVNVRITYHVCFLI